MKIKSAGLVIIFSSVIVGLAKADGLPANPWTNQQTFQQSVAQQLQVKHTGAVKVDDSAPVFLPGNPRRQVGAVGKISAPLQTRKTMEQEENSISSAITDIFTDDSSNTETQPQKTSSTTQMPEVNTDFSAEYEKIKRQGLNKWNNATAPLKTYYRKWRQALQETSEMNLKDFMP